MLYATTRSDHDAYTPQRILWEKRGSDGGLFVPFRNPLYSAQDLNRIAGQSFPATVAELLNLQFNSRISSHDVDFAVGRYPVRLQKLTGRIIAAECWHNTRGELDRIAENLSALLNTDSDHTLQGDWIHIAVRIAILFGIYGELNRVGLADPAAPFDISLVSGDFVSPVSAWYARQWGLPIGNIVCCCNENSGIWNLFAHGQLRTDGAPIPTLTPKADVVVPESLERLVYGAAGPAETESYVNCVKNGSTWYLHPAVLTELRRGIHVSVVSEKRMLSTIRGVYSAAGYLLSPYDALCHGGLQDYRSRTGATGWAVMLCERSAELDRNTVGEAIGLTPEELKL